MDTLGCGEEPEKSPECNVAKPQPNCAERLECAELAPALAVFMQSGALFPLTLTLSPRERELISTAWEYSLTSEHFPALQMVLPLLEGEGWGKGKAALDLPVTALGRAAPFESGSKLRALQTPSRHRSLHFVPGGGIVVASGEP